MTRLRGSTVFITGATGEIGGELLRRFLDAGATRVFCLVRSNAMPPEARLSRRLGTEGQLDPRVVPIEGNVERQDFGIAPGDLAMVLAETQLIFHCAASTSFLKSKECWSINVGGVKALLGLLPRFERGARLFYFGSPSASGDIRSQCLTEDQYPRSDAVYLAEYSASKAAAETLLATHGTGSSIVVLRPSMVVPDTYVPPDILCGCLWPLHVMKECSALPLDSDALVDLVPLSVVGEATAALAGAELEFDCYHISAGREGATRWGEVTRLLGETFGLGRPIICTLEGEAWTSLRRQMTRHEVAMMRSVACYFPFINQNITYDNRRLIDQCGPIDPARLMIQHYLPRLLKLVELDAAIERSQHD